MTSQKLYSIESRGFVVVDVILALSLAALLVGMITFTTFQAENMYDRAVVRSEIVKEFEKHESDFVGLMPGDIRYIQYDIGTSTDRLNVHALGRWYGNDRIETDMTVSIGSTSIDFTGVRAYEYAQMSDSAGTPLCSVDYGSSTITAISLPINPLLPLTDLIVRNGVAYVSTDSTTASDQDLFVIDIKNRIHPTVLSSINTGPGLAQIALEGRYIFAAAPSTAAQLHVIRLDALNSLVLAKKYQLPLPEASTSPSLGSSIFFNRSKVYLGTEKWDGDEFSVIDVSVPESPSKISGIETGSKVNDIFVRGNTAYVAASDQSQLRTINVANPASPTVTNTFSPSGWQRQEGKSVQSFENDLGFSRTSGGFNISSDYELFEWLGTSTAPISLDNAGGIYGIVMDRNKIYAITHTLDRELSIYDRTLSTTTVTYRSLPVLPQAITCDNSSIFILAKNAPVIYELK